jgi:SAM-dependent methyltransferase
MKDRLQRASAELSSITVYEVSGSGEANHLYGPNDAIAQDHLDMDEGRLAEFMALLPVLRSPARVLELGADPYFLTYELARSGYKVTAAGIPSELRLGGNQCVRFEGEPCGRLDVPLVRFNAECDRFPFPGESFDVIVCGELIEHLPHGPDRMLFECNRVLVPGGRLLLSTPNAVSLSRIVMLARRANPDWPFSDQGIYARHNRLYSFPELADLLAGNGFRQIKAKGWTLPHKREWYGRGPIGWLKWVIMRALLAVPEVHPYRLRELADTILVAGIKVGPPAIYRPHWLFGANDSIPMIAGRAADRRATQGIRRASF